MTGLTGIIMRKTWFMAILTGFLVSQGPLAGSVVLCTTQDGRTVVEQVHHHNHGPAHSHTEDCHDRLHTETCDSVADSTTCCQDMPFEGITPSLLETKRVHRTTHSQDCVRVEPVCLSVQPAFHVSSSSSLQRADTQILRSVILLI